MPSPFPGMDPYLEGNLWTSFHAELAPMIAHQLVPLLRPKYIALPERKYISGALEEVMITGGSMRPDVGIRRSKVRAAGPGGAATMAPWVSFPLTQRFPEKSGVSCGLTLST